jgi:pimeloyl-ACP methyl ester carboxylesterase
MEQVIRFCSTGAGRLAYCSVGEGPALVFPAWWVSHLEANWADPSFRAFFLALAERYTVVRYDRIGTGLSERHRRLGTFSLEAEVEVLGELLDHVGVERCTLFGFSSGGCLSAVYAAAHPERVGRIVLYNAYGTEAGSPTRTCAGRWSRSCKPIGGLARVSLAPCSCPRVRPMTCGSSLICNARGRRATWPRACWS